MRTFFVFIACQCILANAQESSEEDSLAKSLYMIQKPYEPTGDVQLGYAYGFLNPYETLHHLVLKTNYRLSTHWQIGLQGSYITSVKNKTTRDLESSLGSVAISTEYQNPEYSLHATVGSIPLSGLLNLFSQKVVPFDLVFGLKVGMTQYKSSGTAPSLGLVLEYKTYFFKKLGCYFGMEYAVEHLQAVGTNPAAWVSQSGAAAGMTWAF